MVFHIDDHLYTVGWNNTKKNLYKYQISASEWTLDEERGILTYEISANRFLRGMVRLIVGSTLNIGMGKLSYEEYIQHVNDGTRSDKMSSAPANGLALCDVTYDFV